MPASNHQVPVALCDLKTCRADGWTSRPKPYARSLPHPRYDCPVYNGTRWAHHLVMKTRCIRSDSCPGSSSRCGSSLQRRPNRFWLRDSLARRVRLRRSPTPPSARSCCPSRRARRCSTRSAEATMTRTPRNAAPNPGTRWWGHLVSSNCSVDRISEGLRRIGSAFQLVVDFTHPALRH